MGRVLDRFGQLIARYLEKPVSGYEPFTPSDPAALSASLKPGDVLLIEGNNHISGVIKYLTQSTWSHAALYVGPLDGRVNPNGEPHTADRGGARHRGRFGAAVEIFALPHAGVPAGRTDRGRLREGLRLCGRAHRVRLRPEEHHRPDALPDAAAGAAALAPPRARARLERSDAHHLLGADRAGLRVGALSDPAEGHPHGEPGSAARAFGDPPSLALCAARLRHLAVFRRGEADHRARLRVQEAALGRPAAAAASR